MKVILIEMAKNGGGVISLIVWKALNIKSDSRKITSIKKINKKGYKLQDSWIKWFRK